MIKVLYNPNQATGGLVQIPKVDSGCPACNNIAPCKYTIANVASGTTITSITFVSAKTGESVVKTIGAYANKYELMDLFRAAFESEGYTVQGTDAIQINPNAGNPANTDYVFIGEAVVTAINALTATATCNKTVICSYTLTSAGGTAIPFVNDQGVSTNVTFDDESTANAVQSQIAGAVTGEQSVTVVKNDDNTFTITIVHLNNLTFSLDGDDFVKSDCHVDYIA